MVLKPDNEYQSTAVGPGLVSKPKNYIAKTKAIPINRSAKQASGLFNWR